MKHLTWYFAFLITVPVTLSALAPFIQPRSQSEDSTRDLIGWTPYINKYDQECFYNAGAVTAEYMQTFKPDHIRFTLFGHDLVNTEEEKPFIQISGSQVGDRNATDWLADYFGLPTDFQSTLTFEPKVTNTIVDLSYYAGLDQWQDGLYFRFHIPIVYTSWQLEFNEQIIAGGVNGYDAGYFAPTAIPRSQLLTSFTDFVTYERVPNLGGSSSFVGLANARMSKRKRTKLGISDIQAAFGWNFLQDDDHHFGLNIRAAAPTGNRPEGLFLFEPLIGNGKHWELGLGVTCHYMLYADPCKPRKIAFYLDGNLTTLFAARQRRTFDLIGKPLSRYMLAQRIAPPVENLYISTVQGMVSNNTPPNAQFQNEYTPLANLTTFDVNVSISAQVDITAMLDIQWCNWNLDFGYNYWARTCEKIKPHCQCSIPFDSNTTFALKGDARIYGFVAADAGSSPVPPGTPIPLSATESQADIHAGTNRPFDTPVDTEQNQNPGIDGGKAQWAMVTETDNTNQIVVFPGENGGALTQQRSTLLPIVIQPALIDFEAAETKGLSNRYFVHLTYNWDSCDCSWSTFAGVGAFIEFAHHVGNAECASEAFDHSCQTVAFSQWGVWLKAGAAF